MQKTIKELDDFLVLGNYAQAIRKSYVGAAKNFYTWCLQQVNDLDFDKPNAHRNYLIERSKKGLAWQTINGDYSAIKMLYTKVLNRDWDMKKTPRPRREKFLPTVLSQDQIAASGGNPCEKNYRANHRKANWFSNRRMSELRSDRSICDHQYCGQPILDF